MPDDYELAADLVRTAGLLAAEMRRQGLDVARKTSISDIVSDADHAAEELVVGRLRADRPDDGVIGEEGANSPGRRTWVIDPVDGTYNFVAGLPIWCAAVALRDGEDLILGAIYQPVTDELWLGGRDRPTTLNGAPVPVLADRRLSEVSVSTYLHPPRADDPAIAAPIARTIRAAATVRMLGSGSVELASVATGRLGLSLQVNTALWDWLPGAALVRAAGGRTEVIEHEGQRWHLAGPPTAVEDAIQAVRSGPA